MSFQRKVVRVPALAGLCIGLAMLGGCAGQGWPGSGSSTGTMGANRSDVRPDAPKGPTGTPGGPTGPAGSAGSN
jgi:hypothetical protein